MVDARRTLFPAAALLWLTGGYGERILNLGGSASMPRVLQAEGHEVFGINTDLAEVQKLRAAGMVGVQAQAEALPFHPCQFDCVIAHQVFHRFAPGLVLSEMARVLRPGGVVGVSYLLRDDSVPWVRRLIAIVRHVDPNAMAGAYGASSVGPLLTSKYFPSNETKNFRVWQPISRARLLDQIASGPGVAAADPADRDALLANVGKLVDDIGAGPDGVRLPYTLRCWRAYVDHEELTAPINIDDDGLVIRI